AGLFARLAAEAALGGLPPVTLLALLKHPLIRLGAAEGAHARAIATLERAVLRGPRPRPGSGGLAQALASFRAELGKLRRGEPSDLHPSEPRTFLSEGELNAAAALAERIKTAITPLETLAVAPQPFPAIAARHQEVVQALSADNLGEAVAFARHDGVKLGEA